MSATILRTAFAYTAAVLTAAILGSIAQTQFNLAAIQALGVEVPPAARLWTTAHDLVVFAPRYTALVAIAFGLALPLAEWIARLLGGWRRAMLILAGGGAIAAAIGILNAALPMTLIASTRNPAGTAAMAVAGAVGGWVYFVVHAQLARSA